MKKTLTVELSLHDVAVMHALVALMDPEIMANQDAKRVIGEAIKVKQEVEQDPVVTQIEYRVRAR